MMKVDFHITLSWAKAKKFLDYGSRKQQEGVDGGG